MIKMLPNKMALQMQNNLPLVANKGQRRMCSFSDTNFLYYSRMLFIISGHRQAFKSNQCYSVIKYESINFKSTSFFIGFDKKSSHPCFVASSLSTSVE